MGASLEDPFRPLPEPLRELVDQLEPAPPESMGSVPDWAATLIRHHSDGTIDAAELPGLKPAHPESGTIGTLEFEGVYIEFGHGGTAQMLVAKPRSGDGGEWMHERLTDYWDTQVSAVETACQRLAELDPEQRARAIDEIERAVTAHVHALDDRQLAEAAARFVDDLYVTAIGWAAGFGRDLFDYLTASAGTLGRLLADRGIQIQYLVDFHWGDPIDALDQLGVWSQASGFTLVSPQELARQLAMSKGARGDEEIARRAPECAAEAQAEVAELISECQKLGGHIVVFDNDGREETYEEALRRGGKPGVVTVYRSAAPAPDGAVKAWLPGPG